ncbi:hypothetical protein GCM10022223_43170 [Kineosporia mesophila]|uniref:AAA+ ATPase domain-containing protein n=1 Tax=Kineosporia mesophila TaxID=566012 RepID=A0ABP7A098_9ACTN|nr:hypothetical protein [Kineosporia mesophila]MCD5353246.1 hypothetical protein [Kineosporia mesophila]
MSNEALPDRQDPAPARDVTTPSSGSALAVPGAEAPSQGAESSRAPKPESSDQWGDADGGEEFNPQQSRRDRRARDEGRRNFSASAAGNRRSQDNHGTTTMGDGSPAFGTVNGNVIITARDRAGSHASLIASESILELAKSFVPWPDHGKSSLTLLVQALSARVCVLVGPVGSGRTALALCALHNLLPLDAALARFDSGVPIARLTKDDFSSAEGFVLEASEAVARRGLRAVVEWVDGLLESDPSTRVVLVVDEEPGERLVQVPAAGFVRHRKPKPLTVLTQLLVRRHRLGLQFDGPRARFVVSPEGQFQPPTDDYLLRMLPKETLATIGSATMEQVAVTAAAIAAAVAYGEKPETYLRSSVRQWVRARLLTPQTRNESLSGADEEPGSSVESRNEDLLLFHRCFLLSAGIFNGLPLRTVLDQTSALTRVIRGGTATLAAEDTSQRSVPAPFSQTSPQLLSGIEAMQEEPETDGRISGVTSERRPMWFRNPTVPDVVLEVVWTEHHLASSAVLSWLLETAVVRRDRVAAPLEVRIRAAQAVGRLAVYDFEQIMAVVETWAKSGSISGRRATALAMDLMLQDSTTAPRTWERLQDWARNWGLPRRLAALTVYAYALDIEHVDDALELVNRSRFQKDYGYALVASVVCRIYELNLTDRVNDLLKEWIEEHERSVRTIRRLRGSERLVVQSQLPGHLVLILLFLGDEEASGTRGQLLRQFDTDVQMRRHVLVLWRMAIRDQRVVRFALNLLADWIKDSDQDPLLDRACRSVLRSLQQDRGCREHLKFHERLWRDTWVLDFPHAQELLDQELGPRGSRR